MPDCDFTQPPSTAGDTPADAQADLNMERQRLIDNIAFLVVRQHRRRQLDEGAAGEPVEIRLPPAGENKQRSVEPGGVATTG